MSDEHSGSPDEQVQPPVPSLGAAAWNARSSAGRKPIFAEPDDLLDACWEYLNWTHANPLMSAEAVKFQGAGTVMSVPKMRAPTLVGLCNFLDISRTTWSNYRERPRFLDTCTRVEEAIYQQKVEGAAADMLNANFIGKEIGLDDKKDDAPGEPVPPVMLVPMATPEQWAEYAAASQAKLKREARD